MKITLSSLPWQCLSVAIAAQAVVAMPASAAPGSIACATPDMWSGAARMSEAATASPLLIQASHVVEAPLAEAAQDGSWTVSYKGSGASRLQGAEKRRILRYGVLWHVDPAALGVSEKDAIAALLKAGAAVARSEGDGRVYYRARKEVHQRVADRAMAMLKRDGVRSASAAPSIRPSSEAADGAAGFIPASVQASRSVQTAIVEHGLNVDVAMLRIEGRDSSNPVEFIESLPGGMSVMPFGTSFVVHVPREMVTGMWDAVDVEGRRVLLVGSSSKLVAGDQAGQAIRSCGGTALLRRFPTPFVSKVDAASAVLDVEAQRLTTGDGDIVLVVQAPPYGRGLEIALMRFVRR